MEKIIMAQMKLNINHENGKARRKKNTRKDKKDVQKRLVRK